LHQAEAADQGPEMGESGAGGPGEVEALRGQRQPAGVFEGKFVCGLAVAIDLSSLL